MEEMILKIIKKQKKNKKNKKTVIGFEPLNLPLVKKYLAILCAIHATYAATGFTCVSTLLIANAYKLVYMNYVTQIRYS